MRVRLLFAFVALVASVATLKMGGTDALTRGDPFHLVVYGDSFTSMGDTETWRDRPELSWATGTQGGVSGVLLRIQAERPDAQAFNAARGGARMWDLAAQVASAPERADEVVLFLGLNDLCARGSEPGAFRDHAASGFEDVRGAHPGARVYVFALPDLVWLLGSGPERVWPLGEADEFCPPIFGPHGGAPGATGAERRRDPFNEALRAESLRNGFEFVAPFEGLVLGPGEVSDEDFFHPNAAGQARLADAAWPVVRPPSPSSPISVDLLPAFRALST